MSEEIKNTETTEAAVLPTAEELPKLVAKLSNDEILELAGTYRNNADVNLAKLQQNIDKLSAQLNDLQKMRLMVLGQRELVLDFIKKITGQTDQPAGA